MKGYRLLTQVMPSTYRQGLTYPTKANVGGRYKKKMKRYGGKILRRWLKEKLNSELDV